MKRKRLALDDYINAVLDRDRGIPYLMVLDRHDLTPEQFFRAVKRIDSFIEQSSGKVRKTLEKISSDESRQRELFDMGEEFAREQYDQLSQGAINRLYSGTRLHPKNVRELIYYALISENPKLKSRNRKKVIEGIKELPKNLKEYFSKRKLRGATERLGDSSLAILREFDKAYQEKTGDASLFDLRQKYHLHEWGDQFNAPLAYWHYSENVEKAVYHTLAERCPSLTLKDRNKVIQGIKRLPYDLLNYFRIIGLGGLMMCAFEGKKRDSPLAVLEVFDRVYMRETGDTSLFDLSQPEHLHKWGDCFHATSAYWLDRSNAEEAIYHTLTERRPSLVSKSRKEALQEIRKLPVRYLCRIGLKSFIDYSYREGKSPIDEVYKMFRRIHKTAG